jgi:Uma2 family endonuclease
MSNKRRQAVESIRDLLSAAVRGLPYSVGAQTPVVVDEYSEPEPDAWVAKGSRREFNDRAVLAADLLLVVEVSDTSLRFDRDVKLPMYAAAGVPEVWIVDVNAQTVEVHQSPQGEAYATKHTVGIEGSLAMAWGGELLVDHMLHGAE